MKISIVTISFNQGEYIKHAFASIAQQAFLQLEYIVVDPGSTDASRAHIDEAHSLISTKILSPDKGPADGLNKGFSLATGEIFGFLNADDVLMPGALVTIEKFFQTHPDVDVVSGHAKIIGADGGFIRLAFSEPFNLRMYAFGCCITMQPSTFFRASAFKRAGGFRTENRTNWDGELWVDMALSKLPCSKIRSPSTI